MRYKMFIFTLQSALYALCIMLSQYLIYYFVHVGICGIQSILDN